MLLIRPQTIDDAVLASSSVAEAAPAAWDAGTTYATGDRVGVTAGTTVQLFKSLADGNTGNDPAVSPAWWVVDGVTYTAYDAGTTYGAGDRVTDASTHHVFESLAAANTGNALDDAAWWLDIGPSNRWAMFDNLNGTATTHPFEIDVTMRLSGRVDSLALMNLQNATAVRVIVSTDADGTLFDETYSLISSEGVNDWYDYFFERVEKLTTRLITGLPVYADPTIRVIVNGNGMADVGLGLLSVGLAKYLGETLHDGAQVGITDYSRKDVDDFGNYTIVERAFSKRGSFQLRLDKGAVDGVYETLAEFRATPAVYSASAQYGSTLIFGFFRDFQIEIDYPTTSLVSVEIEGLT